MRALSVRNTIKVRDYAEQDEKQFFTLAPLSVIFVEL